MAQVPKPFFNRNIGSEIRDNARSIGQLQRSNVQGQWRPLSLVNGYKPYGGNFSPGEYMIDSNGWVHTRGVIKRTGGFVYNMVIATLPVGFRPEYALQHHTACYKTAAVIQVPTYIIVDINGQLRQGLIGSTSSVDGTWVNIDNITFQAFDA